MNIAARLKLLPFLRKRTCFKEIKKIYKGDVSLMTTVDLPWFSQIFPKAFSQVCKNEGWSRVNWTECTNCGAMACIIIHSFF